jgi:hypothetical protein
MPETKCMYRVGEDKGYYYFDIDKEFKSAKEFAEWVLKDNESDFNIIFFGDDGQIQLCHNKEIFWEDSKGYCKELTQLLNSSPASESDIDLQIHLLKLKTLKELIKKAPRKLRKFSNVNQSDIPKHLRLPMNIFINKTSTN